MLILLETPHETVVSRLPESRNIESWHQAMVAEIIAGLGLVHARLFAAPAVGQTGIVWTAPGREMRRFVELPVEDLRAVTAVVGSLLSDIRRLTESGRAPATAAAWPMLR
ncbi:MAG TPA: hypothetical protein PLD10_23860, partial [Rhodopila sp.]|nr:hypothetical protein [Rhodopila sp.]